MTETLTEIEHARLDAFAAFARENFEIPDWDEPNGTGPEDDLTARFGVSVRLKTGGSYHLQALRVAPGVDVYPEGHELHEYWQVADTHSEEAWPNELLSQLIETEGDIRGFSTTVLFGDKEYAVWMIPHCK